MHANVPRKKLSNIGFEPHREKGLNRGWKRDLEGEGGEEWEQRREKGCNGIKRDTNENLPVNLLVAPYTM